MSDDDIPQELVAFDPQSGQWVCESAHDTPSLHTPNDALRFRPWRVEDLSVFRALLNDPEMWQFLPEAYPDPLSEEDARTLIELSNTLSHHYVRAVCLDGVPVGQVRVAFSADTPREAEISYWIGRAYWGRGHGSAAVTQFARDMFDTRSDMDQLMARVHPQNVASQNIMVKAGFAFQEKRQDAGGWQIFARRR